MSAVECCLVNMTCLLHTWTHSSHDFMHKICTRYCQSIFHHCGHLTLYELGRKKRQSHFHTFSILLKLWVHFSIALQFNYTHQRQLFMRPRWTRNISLPKKLFQHFFRKENGTYHYKTSTMNFTDLARMYYERTSKKEHVQGTVSSMKGSLTLGIVWQGMPLWIWWLLL